MSQDTTEIQVASNGNLYVAPAGTSLPTSPTTAITGPFYHTGLVSEEGASFTVGRETEQYKVWQRMLPVRTDITNQTIRIGLSLVQVNADNIKLAFGGGSVSGPTGGVYTYTPPSESDSLDVRAVVLDWQDGPSKLYRLTIPRVAVVEDVEVPLARGQLVQLPLALEVQAATDGTTSAWNLYTNDAGFAAGS